MDDLLPRALRLTLPLGAAIVTMAVLGATTEILVSFAVAFSVGAFCMWNTSR